ncbi:MAG: ribonuclease H-like domain-containing protein [Candidatus Ranarchaeia archaeon]
MPAVTIDIVPEYYFDIETYSPGKRPEPEKDKIITIQYQRIDLGTGTPRGELVILKEWESSEERIVRFFYNKFFAGCSSIWDFVPVGYNLNFEWEFLISKFWRYLGKKFSSRDLHYKIPHLDLKPVVVLLNKGNFCGAKLDKFTGKSEDGKVIKGYYENRQFEKIIGYIKNEAESFLDFLQKIMLRIDRLLE